MKTKMRFRGDTITASRRVIFIPFDKDVEKLCLNDIVEIEIKNTDTKIFKKIVGLELCKIVDLFPDCEDDGDVYAIHGVYPEEFPMYGINTSINHSTHYCAPNILHERAKKMLIKHGKEYMDEHGVVAIILEEI